VCADLKLLRTIVGFLGGNQACPGRENDSASDSNTGTHYGVNEPAGMKFTNECSSFCYTVFAKEKRENFISKIGKFY
jgi:hypothetical protein